MDMIIQQLSHAASVPALVFCTSECRTENGQICCVSSAHRSQSMSVPSDEAVIGELESAADFITLDFVMCDKKEVSVSSPMCSKLQLRMQ